MVTGGATTGGGLATGTGFGDFLTTFVADLGATLGLDEDLDTFAEDLTAVIIAFIQ
jgi:hypothetical protein